jgi:hypothetical protein
MNLDTLLPDPAYRIAASLRIDAPPAEVWKQLLTLPMSALPVGFALTVVRHLPDVLASNEKRVTGRTTFLDATPIPVMFTNEPHQVVSAGISQAWKLVGGNGAPSLDMAQFQRWVTPGWIKVVMSFELRGLDENRSTELSTETRIGVTDQGTTRAFAPYWRVIKPSSALIRREVLAKVKRRAERAERVARGARADMTEGSAN